MVKSDNRRAQSAKARACETKARHIFAFGENGVNCPLQIPNSFAVDNADFQNSPLPALVQIRGDKTPNFSGIERVQIQHAVDWKRHRRFTRGIIRHIIIIAPAPLSAERC
jgi:hypothetical protein